MTNVGEIAHQHTLLSWWENIERPLVNCGAAEGLRSRHHGAITKGKAIGLQASQQGLACIFGGSGRGGARQRALGQRSGRGVRANETSRESGLLLHASGCCASIELRDEVVAGPTYVRLSVSAPTVFTRFASHCIRYRQSSVRGQSGWGGRPHSRFRSANSR